MYCLQPNCNIMFLLIFSLFVWYQHHLLQPSSLAVGSLMRHAFKLFLFPLIILLGWPLSCDRSTSSSTVLSCFSRDLSDSLSVDLSSWHSKQTCQFSCIYMSKIKLTVYICQVSVMSPSSNTVHSASYHRPMICHYPVFSTSSSNNTSLSNQCHLTI